MKISIVSLKSWNEIHQLAKHGWLYRGQRDASWPLQTSIERCCDRESIAYTGRSYIETEFFREFRRSYHQYSRQRPESNAPLEWLSIMQHHGAPTRLLDFSYSIYVAAYFALENADNESAVWAVNGPWALHSSCELLSVAGNNRRDVETMLEQFNEEDEMVVRRLFFEPPFAPLAAPVNPFRLNERLRIQKGVFLCPGTIESSFMKNLTSLPGFDSPHHLLKICIPHVLRHEAIRQLNTMNVNSTSLFPGLDGFARSLGVYHTSFNPVKWGKRT